MTNLIATYSDYQIKPIKKDILYNCAVTNLKTKDQYKVGIYNKLAFTTNRQLRRYLKYLIDTIKIYNVKDYMIIRTSSYAVHVDRIKAINDNSVHDTEVAGFDEDN